jgi:hypothetical protein
MPWLEENQDLEKFRIIVRKLSSIQSTETCQYFGALTAAFREMGISVRQNLIGEWKIFSNITVPPGTQNVFSPFMQLSDADPKLQFYTSLITHNLAASFSQIIGNIGENKSETLQKHRVMNVMKILSDLLISARSLHPASEIDCAIVNRLLAGLAVLFIETRDRFRVVVAPALLRINDADIRNILQSTVNTNQNTRNLFSTFSDRYFPVTVNQPVSPSPVVPGELQKQTLLLQKEPATRQTNDSDLLREVVKMQEDLSGVMKDVARIAGKKPGANETGDQRIGSAEVCARLNISKSTLKEHRENGKYSFTKIGSRYYYSFNEINEIQKLKKEK